MDTSDTSRHLPAEGPPALPVRSTSPSCTPRTTSHLDHEEQYALPLVAARLGASGWATFGATAGKACGLEGAADMFPWLLDDPPAATSERLLNMLPAPARLLCTLWQPSYARTPRWLAATHTEPAPAAQRHSP